MVPGAVTLADLKHAVEDVGYEVLDVGGETTEIVDRERELREEERQREWRDLIIGIIFTLPLFVLAMARDILHVGFDARWTFCLGCLAGNISIGCLFALATPVQFYVGRVVPSRRVQVTARARAEYGRADFGWHERGVLVQRHRADRALVRRQHRRARLL